MASPVKIIIFGRDHESKGEIYTQSFLSPNVALGTSVGAIDKPNEDAAGMAISLPKIVLGIADGHWGRDASELAISKAMSLLDQESTPSGEKETKIQVPLYDLFEQINTELFYSAKSATATPETTLIVCQILESEPGKLMFWASFGDSYLFLLRGEQLVQLNTLNPRWLGYLSKSSENEGTRSLLVRAPSDEIRFVGVAGGLQTGNKKLTSGDIIFLCTDGLVGSNSEPDPTVLYTIRDLLRSDLPLYARVEKIIASALDRGEIDNISCLAALIP